MTPRAAKSPTRVAERTGTLEHLNAAQRQAVTHEGGPLLVLAGAGTGKTTVVTERIAWLIREKGLRPDSIVALTFTEKAALEMEERVDRLLPMGYTSVLISTFHGFCERMLREYAVELGLDPGFRILAGSQQWLLLRKKLFQLPLQHFRPLGNPTKFLRAILSVISAAKDQDITPERLEQYAASREEEAEKTTDALARDALREDAVRWKEIAAVARTYNELLIKEAAMDFGDLILNTLRLFREHPVVLQAVRERFQHVIIDEFQDTNVAQNELLRLLVGDRGNVTAVGDDDQSIYAWRGSNITNILDFQRTYGDVTTTVLTENYRSSQEILDAAYRLIQHNNPLRLEHTAGVGKRLAATRSLTIPGRDRISHRHFVTRDHEHAFLGQTILRLVESGLATYKDCAILTRTNAQIDDLLPALVHRDIPFHVTEARGLLLRPEIRDVSSYLRAVADPFNAASLFRVLSLPEFEIDALLRQKLLSTAKRSNRALIEILRDPATVAGLEGKSAAGVVLLLRLLERDIARGPRTAPSVITLQFLQESGYLNRIIQDERRAAETLPNLTEFLNMMTDYERAEANFSLLEFVEYLDYVLVSGESPPQAGLTPDVDAVRLLTVHAAKGLEFPVVFLPGATADKYPVRDRTEPLELPEVFAPEESLDPRDAHIAEERRLFYVAMTRARDRLTITSAERVGSQRLRRKPSPFLAEAGLTPIEESLPTAGEQLSLPLAVAPVSPLRVGAPQAAPLALPNTISVSQVETYETCPLKYRFQYVFGIPTPPSHALSFGVTVHNVLRDVAQRVGAGKSVSDDDVLSLYERYWNSAGFEDREQEVGQKEHGRTMLLNYFHAHPELQTGKPLFVEQAFRFRLNDITVAGRIDRVNKTSDGSIHVTDYKTGMPKDQKDADANLQLSVYALALREVFHLHADRLTLSYLQGDVQVHTTRDDEDLKKASQRVLDAVARIRAGDFTATPNLPICRMCEFRTICDAAIL